MNSEDQMKLAAYVQISTYRHKVMDCLSEGWYKTPTTIAKQSGILPNHISKTLSELKNKHLIVCINEDARKGRLYKMTELGKEINLILKQGDF